MSLRSNLARLRQSFTNSRSPWTTWISTLVWPSTPFVKSSVSGRRDGRVAVDQLGHQSAHGFDPKRERSDIEKKFVLYLAT
jgi:hypothetical protein